MALECYIQLGHFPNSPYPAFILEEIRGSKCRIALTSGISEIYAYASQQGLCNQQFKCYSEKELKRAGECRHLRSLESLAIKKVMGRFFYGLMILCLPLLSCEQEAASKRTVSDTLRDEAVETVAFDDNFR